MLADCLGILVLYGMASGALVDLWKNGSLFASWRAEAEALAVRYPRLGELAQCDFCLTFQTALWLFLLCFIPSLCVPGGWKAVCQLPVLVLATGRLAWLLNGLLPGALRYSRDSNNI